MASFRAQYLYYSPRGAGWSQNFWIVATDQPTARTAAINLKTALLGILPTDHAITYAKLIDPTTKRVVDILTGTTPDAGLWAIGDTDLVYQPDDCLVVSLTDSANHRNTHYFHPIGNYCGSEGLYNPTTTFVTALTNVSTALTGDGWQVAWGRKDPVTHIPNNFGAITRFHVVRISSHKVGRFFGQPRGRRVKKKSILVRAPV